MYIPLGGSRVLKAKVIRNTFIIFLVSGFWHGANWTFIAWGAYHAVLFLPLILTGKNRKYTNQIAEGRVLPTVKEACQMLLTFLLVVIGWIIFRAESIGQAWEYVCGIFDKSLFSVPFLINRRFYIPLLCFLLLLLVIEWLQREKEHGMEISHLKPLLRYIIVVLMIEVVLFFMPVAPSQFIYFQF